MTNKAKAGLYLKIFLTASIFIFLFRNLKIGYAWSFSDLLPFNTYRDANLLFGTWDYALLGYPYITSSTRIIPLILGMIVRNDIYLQNIYFISFIPISFISMYFLSKIFITSSHGRYLASFLYALNPITIGELFNGSTWMDTYAFTPLVILLVIKFLESENINVIYGLSISILIGLISSNLWITFWTLLFPILLIVSIKLISQIRNQFQINNQNLLRNQKSKVRMVYLFVFIFLGLFLLLPSIDYIYFVNNTAFKEDSIESYFGEIKHNYEYTTPINVIRMAGNAGSPMHFLGYDENNWWTLFGFIIPIFTLLSVVRNNKNKIQNDIYSIPLLVIIIFTIIFLYIINEGYTNLFVRFPFLFSLRNPKYLMYTFSLAISILFGLGFQKLTTIKFFEARANIIFFVILFSLAIYLYPIWDGDMGLSQRVAGYTIPDYYYSTYNYLENNSKDHYRVLWLPYTYETQTRLINNIDHIGIRQGQDLSQSPSYNSVYDLYLSIKDNDSKNMAQTLGFYNVKYVVIDKKYEAYKQKNVYALSVPKNIEIYYQYKTPFIRGPPINFIEYMSYVDGIEKIYDDENIRIYYNHYFKPYIFLSSESKIYESYSSKNIPVLDKNSINNDNFKVIENFMRDDGRIYININKTNEDYLLVLLESYDNNWDAHIGNIKLDHLSILGWANGFKIPKDTKGAIEIGYEPQKHRNIVMSIWIFLWIFVLILLLFQIYILKKNKPEKINLQK